jgi:hypothetical protein
MVEGGKAYHVNYIFVVVHRFGMSFGDEKGENFGNFDLFRYYFHMMGYIEY